MHSDKENKRQLAIPSAEILPMKVNMYTKMTLQIPGMPPINKKQIFLYNHRSKIKYAKTKQALEIKNTKSQTIAQRGIFNIESFYHKCLSIP